MSKFLLIALTHLYTFKLVLGTDDNCPYQKCDCYTTTIDCDFHELKKLPPLHPVTNKTSFILSFNGNSLKNIPARGLPPDLSGIDFQQNPVTTIDMDAFSDSADTLTDLQFADALFTELPDALLRLNVLKHLTISNTPVQTWNETILKHIGATLETLSLTNINLTSWPTWIQYLPHLSALQITSANIFVPDDAFDNQINTLSSLNLENGILTEIPSAVSKLTSLQSLVLDNNNISRLAGIPKSPVLSELSVDSNKISDAGELSEVLRSVGGSLKELRLLNNYLVDLPDFSAMMVLETVYLTNNTISYIGSANMPPSLQYLGLGQNNLPSLTSFLQNGHSLTVLDVMDNSIKDISGVEILANVEYLDIARNLLTELTDESFPQNSSMITLTLDSNPIAVVSPGAFANISKLRFLSLIYTKITRPPLSLAYLTNAISIDLTGNKDMICTCAEKELRSLSQLHQVSIYGQCGVTTIDNFLNVMSIQCPD